MKKLVILVLAALMLSLVSCKNFFTDETAWNDANGNSVVYDWSFGDANVVYKNAQGKSIALRNYAYADSNERMSVFVSPDSTKVCLLVYETSDGKYPAGSVLHIFKLSEENGNLNKQEKIIDSYKLKNELTLTDTSVTYYDTDGNSYEYSF